MHVPCIHGESAQSIISVINLKKSFVWLKMVSVMNIRNILAGKETS